MNLSLSMGNPLVHKFALAWRGCMLQEHLTHLLKLFAKIIWFWNTHNLWPSVQSYYKTCTKLEIIHNQCWLMPPYFSHVYNMNLGDPSSLWIYCNAKFRIFPCLIYIVKPKIGPIWWAIITLMGLYFRASIHKVIHIIHFSLSRAFKLKVGILYIK
jgi:hypothetical protein